MALAAFRLEPEALRYIPAGFAFRHDVLPYAVDGSELLVAVPDNEPSTVDRIRLLTGMRVRATALPREVIRSELAVAYGSADAKEGIESSAPAVRLVDEIHALAVRSRASDVHVEPFEGGGRVRQRVDGGLSEIRRLDRSLHVQVVARLKILASLDVGDRRQPQDGRYSFDVDGAPIDARLSSVTTVDGERLVIRLFDARLQRPSLDHLGMDSETLRRVRALLSATHGFVIVCGPTGSGKTTTLYAALEERRSPEEHVCTIEDPVEMRLGGVTQVQINVRAGMTFARALRAMLRQDPNVVMIGEMRDAETANVAMSAALSGQLVLTSLHSRDAVRAVERLADLGVPRQAVAASLTGIIAQRLVRTSCQQCAGEGHRECCRGSGFAGRTGIFECVAIGAELREAIASGATGSQLRGVVERDSQGSLARDGLRHVIARRTTTVEVQRVLGEYGAS